MPFDIQGARQSGVSDAEINTYLAQKVGFDLEGAKKSGANDNEIADYLSKKVDATAPKSTEPTGIQGMIASIGKADPYGIGEAGKNTEDILKNTLSQSPQSTAIQIGSQGATLAAGPVVAGAKAAFGMLPEQQQQMYREMAQPLVKAANYVSDSAVGDVARQYAGAIKPEIAKTGMALANVAATGAGGNAATTLAEDAIPAAGKGLVRTGGALEKSGQTAFDAARSKYASDLYAPKITPTVAKDRAGSTVTKGWNQTPEYVPSDYEKAAIDTLSQLPVKSSNTLQANLNIVDKAIGDEGSLLKKNLRDSGVEVDHGVVQDYINKAYDNINKSATITGDAKSVADNAMAHLNKLILESSTQDGKISAENLLNVRQKFDTWMTQQKSEAALFSDKLSALNIANKELRNTFNNLVADSVPSAEVKASLLKQSQLIGASENMASKIPSAAKTRLGMVGEKVSNLFPKTLTGRATEAGVAAGLGGLGLATGTLPAIAATGAAGLGLYGAKKAIQSPMLRTAAGKTIKAAGNAMQYKKGLKP